MRPPNPARASLLAAALIGAIAMIGCGGSAGDRTGDSADRMADRTAETPEHVTSVDVTYYYLPG